MPGKTDDTHSDLTGSPECASSRSFSAARVQRAHAFLPRFNQCRRPRRNGRQDALAARFHEFFGVGLVILITSDVVLAHGTHWSVVLVGVTLWGLHMGMTQGLLATMVAHTAPAQLRGTAFGFFNLLSGVVTLVSSGIAGALWDHLGAAATFYAGVGFCVLTVALLLFGRTPDTAAAR